MARPRRAPTRADRPAPRTRGAQERRRGRSGEGGGRSRRQSQRAEQECRGRARGEAWRRRGRPGRPGPTRVAAPRWSPPRTGQGAERELPHTLRAMETRRALRVASNPDRARDRLPRARAPDAHRRRSSAPTPIASRASATSVSWRRCGGSPTSSNPQSVVDRARLAENERRVTIRPAPDTMCYLTALLPVGAGRRGVRRTDPRRRQRARRGRSAGQGAGHGRHPGRAVDRAVRGRCGPRPDRPAHDRRRLLAGDDEPAHLEGFGPVPARIARDMVTLDQPRPQPGCVASTPLPRPASSWPWTPGPTASREGSPRLIRHRDQVVPDTVVRRPDPPRRPRPRLRRGRPTSQINGQGLCEACNHHKQAIGWQALPRARPRPLVETVTPTGHGTGRRTSPLVEPFGQTTRPDSWTRGA